jgi:hypothetical protein
VHEIFETVRRIKIVNYEFQQYNNSRCNNRCNFVLSAILQYDILVVSSLCINVPVFFSIESKHIRHFEIPNPLVL